MLRAKQVIKLIDAPVRVQGLTASGVSTVVTTQITGALTSAGDGGVSVPLQVATSTTIGVAISTTTILQILSNTTKIVWVDGTGNEVYGKLSQSSGVYTLSFYSLIAGVETAYSFSTPSSIDFEFIYKFDFYRLPSSFSLSRNVYDDPLSVSGSSVKLYSEVLTVTALNTVSNLTRTPSSASTVHLFVNNAVYSAIVSDFTVSGTTITWSVANGGFNLETTDFVIAHYVSNE